MKKIRSNLFPAMLPASVFGMDHANDMGSATDPLQFNSFYGLAYQLPDPATMRTPPPIRTTSIYSRSDGVVAWQICRHDKRSSLVHDIEVGGSHIGMGRNREVLAAVADRLGQQPGPWRCYVRAP